MEWGKAETSEKALGGSRGKGTVMVRVLEKMG